MREKYFKNSGERIQSVAIVLFVIQIIGFIISGIGLVITSIDLEEPGYALLGILAIFVGFGIAWLDSIFIYGFGELIENTREKRNTDVAQNTTFSTVTDDEPKVKSWVCSKCGQSVPLSNRYCSNCSTERPKEVRTTRTAPVTTSTPINAASRKCICGNRTHERICPNCGRTLE